MEIVEFVIKYDYELRLARVLMIILLQMQSSELDKGMKWIFSN